MPKDSIKMTPIHELVPQLYQNVPQQKTNYEKQILEERAAQQFLSPQELALRHLMKLGGLQAADLPEIPDVSPQGMFNQLVEKKQAEVKARLAAEEQNKQPEVPMNRQPQSIQQPPQQEVKAYSPDQELQESLNALNKLRGVK